MLRDSHLYQSLERFAFNPLGQPMCLYGDPAYPLCLHLQKPYRNVALTPAMQAYSKAMSNVRPSVEWLFNSYSSRTRRIWADIYNHEDVGRLGYYQLISGKSEKNNCFSECSCSPITGNCHSNVVESEETSQWRHKSISLKTSCSKVILLSLRGVKGFQTVIEQKLRKLFLNISLHLTHTYQ